MKNTSQAGLIPLFIGAVKLILYFFSAMIVINVPMVASYGMGGPLLHRLGATMCLVMMILYIVMVVCGLLSISSLGMLAAVAALVLEAIVIVRADILLPSNAIVDYIMNSMSGTATQLTNIGVQVLKQLIKPAAGLIISAILTLVYLGSWKLSPAAGSRGRSGSSSSYSRPSSRNSPHF